MDQFPENQYLTASWPCGYCINWIYLSVCIYLQFPVSMGKVC